MGFTLSQVTDSFNDLVRLYELLGFKEVPCTNFLYFYPSYRSKDMYIEDESVRISLEYGEDMPNGFDSKIFYIDLSVDKVYNLRHKVSERFMRYYRISNNYFTTNINELYVSLDRSVKRYLSFWSHRSYNLYLSVDKMSRGLIKYLREKVDSRFDDSLPYDIRDVYFSYVGSERKLVIVIKKDHKIASEALFFHV